MKKFHQNYLGRSNETGKKERKVKKHHSEEACKCFAPFVKLHLHDCPLVNKPCPIHGNHFNCIEKEENTEPIQNVTVSFYPSIKTERLFQPVKSLLAHCNPETKINFQYYSQRHFTNKENTKDQFIQTNFEDFKRALSDVFVEKTKSFIADKTNKMKKLKQCFYSPCNSVVRRSLSQSSIREKNEISCEEGQHRNAFFNRTLEEPFDNAKCDSSFELFSPRKLDFENLIKLSDEKKDSDFITFTKRSKNSVINHKIFEIKHKKGLDDISAVKFPKQPTQFVYSAYDIGGSVKGQQHSKRNRKIFGKKITSDEVEKTKEEKTKEEKNDENWSTSEKSQTSSSSSVYVTPFILMPVGKEDRNSSKLIDQETNTMDEPVQMEDSATEKGTQTSFLMSEQMKSSLKEKPQLKSNQQQTDSLTDAKHSQTSREIFLRDYEQSVETMKYKFKECDTVTLRDDFSDDIYWRKKCSEASWRRDYLRTTEVQTNDSHQYEKLVLMDTCRESIRDQSSQTKPGPSRQAPSKTFESKVNNRAITHPTRSTKNTQTSFSEIGTSTEFSNLTDFHSSDVLVRTFDRRESDIASDKMLKVWSGKSCSDTELYEKKTCKCSKANLATPVPEICFCKRFNQRDGSNIKASTWIRFYEDNQHDIERNKLPDSHKTVPETQKTVERSSKAEQTTPIDEYSSQTFSDLSELKKIILKYFENKASENCNKSEIDKARMINVKSNQGTMTDSTIVENKPVLCAAQKPREMNNAETQTTVHILMEDEVEKKNSREAKVKFRQSVSNDNESESKTLFVCSLCSRDMNRFCSNVSTNTDNPENVPKVKEKTTVIDTKYSKIIEVKTIKKTKNSGTSKEPICNCKTSPKHITSPETEKCEREKTANTLKLTENSPRDTNSQKSSIPILITEPGPTYARSDVRSVCKDRNPPLTETRNMNFFAQEWTECATSTNPQIRQKTQSSRPPAVQQLSKQCICVEIAGQTTTSSSKITPACISPDPSKVKKYKIQSKADIFPSTAKMEHPGVENSQWRKEERSHTNPKTGYKRIDCKRTDGFFYPVGIKTSWPMEVKKVWETAEKFDNSECYTLKQKRGHEKELESKETPAGKKIKAFCEESKKECFLFGEPTFPNSLRGKRNRGSRSIWVPSSSVPKVSSQNDFLNQYKTTKSEEFGRTSHQREVPFQVKRHDSDTSNELFTVESCHLKPVTFKYDQAPFNNLFKCSFCKSLTFLKTSEEDASYFWPNSTLLHHDGIPEESLIEEVANESTPDNLPQHEEELLSLEISDTTSLPLEESLENDNPEEEEEDTVNEFIEWNPQRSKPKSQSQTTNTPDPSFYYNVPSGSKFLKTFRFSKDPKKYKFKKYAK